MEVGWGTPAAGLWWVDLLKGEEGWGRTFCGIRGLVVFGEPLQVFVLDPGDPVIVLAVVELAGLLLVGLALGVLVVVCHFDVFRVCDMYRFAGCGKGTKNLVVSIVGKSMNLQASAIYVISPPTGPSFQLVIPQ